MAEYQVTQIALSGGSRHEHITNLYIAGQWYTRQQVVQFISQGHRFFTDVGGRRAYLKIVDGVVPYVQTYADNTLTDNLLYLPRAA